jgi:hypothetical protein
VFVGATVAALALAMRGRRLGLALLIVIAIVDTSLFNVGCSYLGKRFWYKLPTAAEFTSTCCPDPPFAPGARVYDNRWCTVDMLGYHGYRSMNGYCAMAPNRCLDYQHVNSLRVAEVQAYALPPFGTTVNLVGVPPAASDGWRHVPNPLPRVRLVSQVMVSSAPREDLKRINVDSTALVSHPIDLRPSTPGTAELNEDRPGKMAVAVEAPQRQLLVVSECFDAGWRVRIDSQPTRLERVNGDFMGCVVAAGKHRVDLVFRPPSVYFGKIVTLLAFAATVVVIFGARRGMRMHASAAVPRTEGNSHVCPERRGASGSDRTLPLAGH